MKQLLAILFTVLITLPALSQLNWGIKAGLSTTSITMADAKSITSGGTTYTIDKLKGANYGIQFGAFARLKIAMLYIQPELLFSTRSNEYTLSKANSLTDSITVKQNFNKLDIPVMLGLKFGPLRVNAGPVGSLRIGSPKNLVNDPDFKAMYAQMTFGYQAGIGLDIFKKLTLDVRYEGSLKKYQNQIENTAGTKFNLDDRPNSFLFSVGLMF